MTDVINENERTRTVKTVMFGRTKGKSACKDCQSTHEYWGKQRRRGRISQYTYVSADSAPGKKWLKNNNVKNIPASKVCVTKDGKTRCNVYVGSMPGAKKLVAPKIGRKLKV